MSWLTKLLPPKIKREQGQRRSNRCRKACGASALPARPCSIAPIWKTTCTSAPSAVTTTRMDAAQRLDLLLDAEGRFEIGAEVVPVDSLKFKDTKKYPDRLMAAQKQTGENDALIVMQGRASRACRWSLRHSSSSFMGGSMGSVRGRALRAWRANCRWSRRCPSFAFPPSGGARMQEGLFSLMQMAKTSAALAQLCARPACPSSPC